MMSGERAVEAVVESEADGRSRGCGHLPHVAGGAWPCSEKSRGVEPRPFPIVKEPSDNAESSA